MDEPFSLGLPSQGVCDLMTARHRISLAMGVMSFVFAALPWLGFGAYAFAVPGGGLVPRLSVVNETDFYGGRLLYHAIESPLHLVGFIPPLGDLVFFAGEGVVTVRPFMVFVFWLIVGIGLTWIAVRSVSVR